MPRFLETSTGEFVWIDDPSKVHYAILSHVWDHPGEQTYHDVIQLQEIVSAHASTSESSGSTLLSHPALSLKTKGLCEVARKAGYKYAWTDACCINKFSSSEEARAINSMYQWYSLADVCYVFLSDVSDDEDPAMRETQFRKSKWHKRGWTLQELIASRRVLFYTSTWKLLGTKMGLATVLEDITGIDFNILTGTASLKSASIARRMSWAASRETTLVEDKAYCLLGIFGVHISPIYGEGCNAFLRLQKEIAKTIPDQSIFAWGRSFTMPTSTDGAVNEQDGWASTEPGMFAESPRDFKYARDITPLSGPDFAARIGQVHGLVIPPLRYLFTPEGVSVPLLCLQVSQLSQANAASVFSKLSSMPAGCTDCQRLARAHSLAFLRCRDGAGSLVALPLCRFQSEGYPLGSLAIAFHMACNPWHAPKFRVVRLSRDALAMVQEHAVPESVEVSLLRHGPATTTTSRARREDFEAVPRIQLWSSRSPPSFSIAPRCIEQLRLLGFTVSPLRYEHRSTTRGKRTPKITLTTAISSTGSGADDRGQTVTIILVLRASVGAPGRRTQHQTTTAHFSITNSVQVSQDERRIATSSGSRSSTDRCGDSERSYGMKNSRSVSLNPFISTRVIAEVDFIIHMVTDPGNDEADFRRMRLGLERPLSSLRTSSDEKNIWFSIELSDKYRGVTALGDSNTRVDSFATRDDERPDTARAAGIPTKAALLPCSAPTSSAPCKTSSALSCDVDSDFSLAGTGLAVPISGSLEHEPTNAIGDESKVSGSDADLQVLPSTDALHLAVPDDVHSKPVLETFAMSYERHTPSCSSLGTQPEASLMPASEPSRSPTPSNRARYEAVGTGIEPDAASTFDELRCEMEDMRRQIATLNLELEGMKKCGSDVGVWVLYSIMVCVLAYCVARGSW
ncbi:Vegetative incompatibility protein HET-E-1 [Trametes pubescens]|uniref:Vegetative incompatibility protein HET-E-1 n=1 Tax=Trametes pubescens TaxID=154538 RepID=A0A1M2VV51_TRAPU|nr:Vegetative incompatibility protein HET-E-1 [Trametes pubescens]